MSAERVCEAWAAGRRRKSGNVSTDGAVLRSRGLIIGRTENGKKIAIDYRRKVSGSTTRHVGIAIRHADAVEAPPK